MSHWFQIPVSAYLSFLNSFYVAPLGSELPEQDLNVTKCKLGIPLGLPTALRARADMRDKASTRAADASWTDAICHLQGGGVAGDLQPTLLCGDLASPGGQVLPGVLCDSFELVQFLYSVHLRLEYLLSSNIRWILSGLCTSLKCDCLVSVVRLKYSDNSNDILKPLSISKYNIS